MSSTPTLGMQSKRTLRHLQRHHLLPGRAMKESRASRHTEMAFLCSRASVRECGCGSSREGRGRTSGRLPAERRAQQGLDVLTGAEI